MKTQMGRNVIVGLTFLICSGFAGTAMAANDLLAAATPDHAVDSDLAIGRTYDSHMAKEPGAGAMTGDTFGGGGYVHPFLSLAEGHSDNVYNVNANETSDWYSVISPGIWLAAPGSREQLLDLSTSNTSPGGLVFARDQNEVFRRVQTYLLYQADILRHSDESAIDTEHHRAEGLLQFNLKGGITLDLVDEFKIASDPLATTTSGTLDEYESNMFDSILNFDISKKFSLALGGGLYTLDYDFKDDNGDGTDDNAFRDRDDTSYNARMSYHVSPKTSLFAKYRFVELDYDLATVSDSEMQYAFAGIQWNASSKSLGKISAGYIDKDFEMASKNDVDDFGFEIQLAHEFTPKTTINLVADRSISETTESAIADYVLTHNVSITYLQDFTTKFSGNLFLFYSNEDYEGDASATREDDTYIVSPTFDYTIADWLITGISYSYTERDSNEDVSDYKNNSFMLRVTLFL